MRRAEVFPPGEFIADELRARGMAPAALMLPVSVTADILSGNAAITPVIAGVLAKAFGTSTSFWLNLEAAYRLWLSERDALLSQRRAPL